VDRDACKLAGRQGGKRAFIHTVKQGSWMTHRKASGLTDMQLGRQTGKSDELKDNSG
jgi:hypothetical protein